MASYVLSMMNKHDLEKYGEYMAQGSFRWKACRSR
jgi:hypothetical protein